MRNIKQIVDVAFDQVFELANDYVNERINYTDWYDMCDDDEDLFMEMHHEMVGIIVKEILTRLSKR